MKVKAVNSCALPACGRPCTNGSSLPPPWAGVLSGCQSWELGRVGEGAGQLPCVPRRPWGICGPSCSFWGEARRRLVSSGSGHHHAGLMVWMSRHVDRLLWEAILLSRLVVHPSNRSEARGQLPTDPADQQVADVSPRPFSIFPQFPQYRPQRAGGVTGSRIRPV